MRSKSQETGHVPRTHWNQTRWSVGIPGVKEGGTRLPLNARASIEKLRPVERVALDRAKARVRDEPAQLFFRRGIGAAGGADDVFFDEDAAHVVPAEAQRNLADFMARGQPGSLDVEDIVEVAAGYREGLEVVDGRGFFLDRPPKGGMGGLEHPGDERRKSSCLFLELPKAFEVADAVFQEIGRASCRERV